MKKRKWLSLLLAVMMLVSAVPFFPVTADAADGTVEVSTWAELKKALEYTTNCSVVKVVKDIETKSLNGHTGLHQDNIIFMSMAMDKVLDLNGSERWTAGKSRRLPPAHTFPGSPVWGRCAEPPGRRCRR